MKLRVIILFCLLFTHIQIFAAENFLDDTGDAKPISWWMFEDSATPTLDGNTANANDLTWTGTITRDTTLFKQGSASTKLNPTGTDLTRPLANVSSNFPLKSGTGEAGFTVGGWVYIRTAGTGELFARFDDVVSGGWGFQTIAGPKVHMDTPTTAIVSDSNITLNDWTHIVARYNGDGRSGAGADNESSFWVNGTKQSTTLTHSAWSLANGPLSFTAPNNDMNFDEWFAFNYALLDTQIADIYNYGLAGSAGINRRRLTVFGVGP